MDQVGQQPNHVVKVDVLEKAYKSVLFGRRICQLYCFMLLFEPISALISFIYRTIIWLFISGLSQFIVMVPVSLPTLESLTTSRTWLEFVAVANIWFIYYVYSSFRPAWWILVFCFAALSYNQYAAYIGLVKVNTDWPDILGRDVGGAVWLQSVLFMGGLFVSHIYFMMLAVNGQRAIHRLEHVDRNLLSENIAGQNPVSTSVGSLVNIPPAIRYAKGKLVTGAYMVLAGVANFVNYWRLTIVFLFACMLPLIVILVFPNGDTAIKALMAGNQVGPALQALGVGMVLMLILFGILFSIPWVIKRLGKLAVRAGQNRMRTSLENIQHDDGRSPILFLRSFANDRVPIPSGKFSLSGWLLDGAGAADTLDYLVLDEGTKTGPTVALGNPDDPAPPYGVARGYFDHDDWQDAVSLLCADAKAILFVLDQTEGVKWELSHIAGHEYLNKTLFLIAPKDIGQDQGNRLLERAVEKSCDLTGEEARLAISKLDKACMGFSVENGIAEYLTTDRASQYSYLVSIRRFLYLL